MRKQFPFWIEEDKKNQIMGNLKKQGINLTEFLTAKIDEELKTNCLDIHEEKQEDTIQTETIINLKDLL